MKTMTTPVPRKLLTIEIDRSGVGLARRLAPWSAALLALVVLAAGWFVWRATFPMEIFYNEPWNAWLSDLALRRDALYPPSDALTLNNYPPLSFVLLHFVAAPRVFANALYAGRAVSFVSTFVVAAAVYRIARELGAGKASAALGALSFVALVLQFFDESVAACDQNMLGLAAMYWAFYMFLRSSSTSGVLASFAAMAAAGLIKHHLAAAPLAAVVCLWFVRPRLALAAALFGALVCAALTLVCWGVYGDNFFAQMLAPRQILLGKPIVGLVRLQWVAPLWPFWFYWLAVGENARARRVTLVMTATSVAVWMVWRLGAGVSANAELELIVASTIAFALTLEGLDHRRLRLGRFAASLSTLCALAMVARAVASGQDLNYLAWLDSGRRAAVSAAAETTAREIARVAAIPGEVSCSVRTVCYLAGKAYVYDPYGVEQSLKTGRATPAEIEAKARAIRFAPVSAAARW
jgi:hypothetical protein